MQGETAKATVREVFARVQETQLSFLAASLAYYMLVSLLPLGLLALVVATTLGEAAFAERVVGSLDALLSDSAATLVQDSLLAARGRGGATVIGLLVLSWSALRVFRGLDVAFSLVYGHGRHDTFLDQFRDACIALGGIAVAVVAIAVVTALVALSGTGLVELLGPFALMATLAVAFLPVYVVFPDTGVRVSVREALPGTLVAAGGWTLLGSAFSVYASLAGSVDLFGVLGGVLLLVTWFYAASLLLLLGAVVNAVLAGHRPVDRQLQHGSVRTDMTMTDDDSRDDSDEGETPPPGDPTEGVDPASEAEVDALREELEEFRSDVESRTLHRDDVEGDLRGYVRREIRRGHARDWGPYVVLLYGTIMTIGAFYYQPGWSAVLAMIVIWLSTLGLYVVMVVVGIGLNVTELPSRIVDRVRNR